MAKHSIRDELVGVLVFVGVIWCVFIVGQILPFQLDSYGITPRTLRGLVGIPASPFLHADLAHIVSNTIPLTVLLLLLAGSRGQTWTVVASIVLVSGALLWLFGRSANHIGASGLIYGLIAYLLVSGLREGRVIPFIIAVVVWFLYGGTLAAGILPSLSSHVSWEGHLFGMIAGGAIAYWQTRDQYREGVYSS
jgi:membrane associated rhomboid family serine protease